MRTSVPPLGRRLEEVEQPTGHLLQVRDVPLPARLYATAPLHRLVPTRAAVRLAEVAARLAFRASRRCQAEGMARARAVLGAEAAPAAVRAFARRELIERWASVELFWRPWVARRTPIEGFEHLDAARARGRGVILLGVHQGPAATLFRALPARGVKLYIARFRKVRDDPVRFGAQAPLTQANVRWAEAAGCRWVGRGGAFGVFRALLERNEVCRIGFDLPGEVETTMGGRTFHLAAGIAKLSRETGAAVVPTFALRRGHRSMCWMEPPIDPAGFADAETLHRHLAEIAGRMLFAHPEQAAQQIQLLAAARP